MMITTMMTMVMVMVMVVCRYSFFSSVVEAALLCCCHRINQSNQSFFRFLFSSCAASHC